MVLSTLRGTVEGTVVDSAGKPLADAIVFNVGGASEPIATRTDAAGRFRFEGLLSGPAYVFASKPDYRFTGLIAASGASGVVVKLLRRGEPVPPWPRPAPRTFREEQEVARRCLVKLWEVARDSTDKKRLIEAMARIDLRQAEEWSSESHEGGWADINEMQIKHAADQVAGKDIDEAIKLLEADESRVDLWDVLGVLARRYAASDPAKAMRSAEKMASLARESGEAERLARAGILAMRLGSKNESTGRKWVEEAVRLIPKPDDPAGDHDGALCEVARAVAACDLKRAVGMLKELKEPRLDNEYLTRLAIAGCLNDLEQSLQIINDIKPEPAGDAAAQYKCHLVARDAWVRIACRLAATKPERAVKLIEDMPSDNGERASAFGRLAVAMAPHHKALAWSLMDRALPTGMERFVVGFGVQETGPEQAALLAAQAREIGYPDMQNAVWRVLASDMGDGEGRAMLALADRETAQQVFQVDDRRDPMIGLPKWYGTRPDTPLSAWALVDLKHAEELLDRQLADIKKIAVPHEQAERAVKLLPDGGSHGRSPGDAAVGTDPISRLVAQLRATGRRRLIAAGRDLGGQETLRAWVQRAAPGRAINCGGLPWRNASSIAWALAFVLKSGYATGSTMPCRARMRVHSTRHWPARSSEAAEHPHALLRRVEAHAVVGRHVVPSHLGAADQGADVLQLVGRGPGLGGGGDVEVGQAQGPFGPAATLGHLVLDRLDPAADLVFAPAVANGTRIGDVRQRAPHAMVSELHAPFGPIGHVAVGAGHVAIGVDARR